MGKPNFKNLKPAIDYLISEELLDENLKGSVEAILDIFDGIPEKEGISIIELLISGLLPSSQQLICTHITNTFYESLSSNNQ